MVAAAVVSLYLQVALGWDSDEPRQFAYIMLITVGVTTVAWFAATLMTPPESEETLRRFYERVRPYGPGWTRIASLVGGAPPPGSLARDLSNAFLGCVLVYAALFGVGELLLGSALMGMMLLAASAISAAAIARNL